MRLLFALAVLSGIVFATTGVSARPTATAARHAARRPRADVPKAPPAPDQVIATDDFEGIGVKQMTYITPKYVKGMAANTGQAEALIVNNTRFTLTAVTLRFKIADASGQFAYFVPFKAGSFLSPDTGRVSDSLGAGDEAWVKSAAFPVPPSVANRSHGYWMELVAARGRPAAPSPAMTPQESLSWAAMLGDMATVQALVTAHPELVNGQDKFGATPLHQAALGNHPAAARFLLDHGAALDAKDRKGRTPLFIAIDYENTEIVRLLLSHHADPQAKTQDGVTCLDAAQQGARQPGGGYEIAQLVTDASQGKWPLP